jgi:hypothetical protein
VNNNSNRPTIRFVPQETLRRELPKVTGNVDYTLFEEELKGMDEIMLKSGIKRRFAGSTRLDRFA